MRGGNKWRPAASPAGEGIAACFSLTFELLLALFSSRGMTANYWNDLNLARKGLLAAFLPSAALLLGLAALYGVSMAERRAQTQI